MYLPTHGGIYIPSCSAGCEGSTEGSLGRVMLIVVERDQSGGPRASAFASESTAMKTCTLQATWPTPPTCLLTTCPLLHPTCRSPPIRPHIQSCVGSATQIPLTPPCG